MAAGTRDPPLCRLKTSGAQPRSHNGSSRRVTAKGKNDIFEFQKVPSAQPARSRAPGPCTSDAGCSLCGSCDVATGTCRCDRGFAGANCEVLNMGGALKCGEGGLCMVGERVGSNSGVEPTTGYATWGGSVVSNPDFSEFHM